jgi:hypothetical protein
MFRPAAGIPEGQSETGFAETAKVSPKPPHYRYFTAQSRQIRGIFHLIFGVNLSFIFVNISVSERNPDYGRAVSVTSEAGCLAGSGIGAKYGNRGVSKDG